MRESILISKLMFHVPTRSFQGYPEKELLLGTLPSNFNICESKIESIDSLPPGYKFVAVDRANSKARGSGKLLKFIRTAAPSILMFMYLRFNCFQTASNHNNYTEQDISPLGGLEHS